MTQVSSIPILDDFKDTVKIYETDNVLVYRGVRKIDSKPVILKTLKSLPPKPEQIEAFKHEYSLLQHLKGVKGVNQAYDLLTHPNLTLVEEDNGAISLKDYLKIHDLSQEEFLKIAIQIVDVIANLHAHQVIHKDLNPSNLIINPSTKEIRIIDFSLASQLNEEAQEEINPHLVLGTIAYLAPERTGRMNRPADYRSDFYSLGVTCFEMLTKRLPFESKDPLEIIHDHIAKLPPAIPHVSTPLAQIVHKLMAKNPDDRYASSMGIKADLVRCLESDDFEIGRQDVMDHFHISHKLYGREEQKRMIFESYHRVSQGEKLLVLISGYSGIGKTSLVHEVYLPMTQDRGIFISGKFDQLQRNIAYSGFIQAFHQLIHQLLSETEENLARFRREIKDALGASSQAIIEVIPDLELIIGKQPPVPTLTPQQAQNRFIYAFKNFVNIFSKAGHPLVIFLDDLQWADAGSLQIIQALLTDTSLKNLFFIGAYRDNEVDDNHPLILTVKSIKKTGLGVQNIVLTPLSKQNVYELVTDSFKPQIIDPNALVNALYEKTAGNPFFIIAFIKLLYREHIFFFNYQKIAWEVKVDSIKNLGITDNVVDLMIQNIQQLSIETQELLKQAACIGYTFDLKTLKVVSELDPEKITMQLWEALQKGLIVGVNYKRFDFGKDIPDSEHQSYKFVHDRIQQAAYNLIPESIRQQKHLVIGRLLLRDWKDHPNDVELPSILNHFIVCLYLISDRNEKLNLATYFLKVGTAAKDSIAYEAAYNYLKAGIAIQEPQDWDLNFDLLFQLHCEFAETEYLLGRIDSAREQYNKLLDLSKDRGKKQKVYTLLAMMYTHLGQHTNAIDCYLSILKLYNVNINKKINYSDVLIESIKLKWDLGLRHIPDLDKQLGAMTDQDQFIITKTMASIFVLAYQSNNELLNYITFRLFRMYLRYGYCSYTPIILTLNSIINIALNKIDTAFELTDLSKKIELLVDEKSKQIREFAYGYNIHHYKYPIATSTDLLMKCYKNSLEGSDFTYASFAMIAAAVNEFNASKFLKDVLIIFNQVSDFTRKVQNQDWRIASESYAEVVKFLLGLKPYEVELVEKLTDISASPDLSMKATLVSAAARLSFFADDGLRALEKFELWYDKYKKFHLSLYSFALGITFFTLCITDGIDKVTSNKRKKYRKVIQESEKKLSIWSKHCPGNFLYLHLLICAEMARINKNEIEALKFYAQAIEAAKKNEFNNFVAIINERVGNYYQQLSNPKSAKGYIEEAYRYYELWGAQGKLNKLEQTYPQWFLANQTMTLAGSHSTKLENLDLLSISKATQAISEEIVLDCLLTRIIQIVLENAAAQRVVILQGQPLRMIAEGTLEKVNVHEAAEPTPEDLPLSILAYVLRTKQAVVLHDASNQPEQFKQDPYLAKNQIKSVLCAPISYQSKIMGILYLENNLVTHAFTQDRLKVLSILSSQAAISLENSRHFERMNQLYQSTERFVPKPFLDLLHKENIEDVLLGDGVEQDVSVLFTDLRNFTTLIQRRTPGDAFVIINRYLEHMAPIIRKYQGFINQFQGDGILALFPRAADDALQAGMAMLSALKEFNQAQRERGEVELDMGVGINTGPALLGITGEKERMEPTVVSDAANTGARIESLNKTYNTHLLLSQATFDKLQKPDQFALRRIDKVFLKGRDAPTSLYEVIDWTDRLIGKSLEDYLKQFYQAFVQYEKGDFAVAKAQFAECLKYLPQDRVTEILIDRCILFMKEGTPKNWDGTFMLTHK